LKLVWSPLALERAIEQARFIARDKPGAAERWLEGLFSAAEELLRLPRLGRIVPEVRNPDIRELSYGTHRLIYRVGPRQVSLLTIRHGRRQLDLAEIAGKGDASEGTRIPP
jgi:toxin ParE1/3/4